MRSCYYPKEGEKWSHYIHLQAARHAERLRLGLSLMTYLSKNGISSQNHCLLKK